MAETLPNGAVVPNANGGETISASGVQEMRTLGASVDAALGSRATLTQLDTKADQTQVDDLAGKVFFRGAIPSGSNLDTWLTDAYSGLWRTTAGVSPTLSGVPEERRGQPFQILHMGSAARVTTQMLIPYGFYSTTMLSRSINDVTNNTWTDWVPVGGGGDNGSVTSLAPYSEHAARQALMVSALGGPIDTGGLGAVAFRFDHGMLNFRDKVLPAVKARGIKVAQAYNPRRWHLAENAGVTATDLNGWVAAGDVEIMNHSATHIAAETPADLQVEIVDGLAEIEAELPAAAGQVWGFAPPGFTGGDYMGFNDGRTPAGWGSYAGRLILQHHAVASGYLPGTRIRPLDGTIRDGQGHYTIDGTTVADIKGYVDAAITQRGGLQLMLHPSQLDTPGNLTTAQFVEVLDYVVAKRDAGELAVLSPYQMMVADSTRPPVTVPDVTGLAARLAALEYNSGWRDITSRVQVPITGQILVKREKNTVWIDFRDFAPSAGETSSIVLSNVLPDGFKPPREMSLPLGPRVFDSANEIKGSARVYLAGNLAFYRVAAGAVARGIGSFPTEQTPPATLPGIPA